MVGITEQPCQDAGWWSAGASLDILSSKNNNSESLFLDSPQSHSNISHFLFLCQMFKYFSSRSDESECDFSEQISGEGWWISPWKQALEFFSTARGGRPGKGCFSRFPALPEPAGGHDCSQSFSTVTLEVKTRLWDGDGESKVTVWAQTLIKGKD